MNPVYRRFFMFGRLRSSGPGQKGFIEETTGALYRLLGITALMLLAGPVCSATHTLFYTVGHQDDWQLFMNPNAFYDAHVPDARVVFIYMTAGDAGRGTARDPGAPVAYFRARELGAMEGARFIATPPRYWGDVWRPEIVEIDGRQVVKQVYGNTRSYFLRLPDGNPVGGGYRRTGEALAADRIGGMGSLRRLWQGGPRWIGYPSLTDIEDLQSYTAEQLISLLQGIIREEARGSSNVWINIPNRHATPGDGWDDAYDDYTVRDPYEDHADHIYAGWFMYQAARAFSCINRAEFRGYPTALEPVNLTAQQLIWEAGTWGATSSGLLQSRSYPNTFNDEHNAWLGRNYFEAFRGAGACGPDSF